VDAQADSMGAPYARDQLGVALQVSSARSADELLDVAFRKSFDLSIGYWGRRVAVVQMVMAADRFADQDRLLLGGPAESAGLDYATVLAQTTARIAFAEADLRSE
jgi:hypothetical protein